MKGNLTNILKEIQADLRTWCSKLGEAAYKKNITFHRAVKETPYRIVFGIDPKKEIQMKVPEEEEDQQTETANEIERKKRKSSPTFEVESRKRMRTEANSHQMVYNETMKKSRQKAKGKRQKLSILEIMSASKLTK